MSPSRRAPAIAAGFPDAAYREKGATIVASRDELFAPPTSSSRCGRPGPTPGRGPADIARLRRGQTVIGLADPLTPERGHPGARGERGVTSFALELMPRITRAQSMDVLSSMASIAGLQGRAARCRGAAALLPDAHDRRRHHHPGAGVRHRRRRGRAPGHRHREAARARGSTPTTSARRSRTRSRAWARNSSSCRSRPRPPRARAATRRRRTSRSIGASAS